MSDILSQLGQVIDQRKDADSQSSYVASLHKKGLNKILEKVGEEAFETVLAAKDAQVTGEKADVIYETADLIFHSLVMLSHLDIKIDDVLQELARREGVSGHEEKASRTK